MKKGLLGIASFALGGMLLFLLLDIMSHFDAGGLIIPFPILIFVSFLLMVPGLWLIVRDEKPQKEVRTKALLVIVGIASIIFGALFLYPIVNSFQYIYHNAFTLPQPIQGFMGFMLAGIGIWLISQSKTDNSNRT